jgi:NADH-quinone oxidoreductase subunit N
MWAEEPKEDAPSIKKKPVGIYAAIAVAAVGTVVLLFAFDPVLSTATEAAKGLLGV